MAFGIGKAFKKLAHKALGDYDVFLLPNIERVIGSISGGAMGFITGGPVGATVGAVAGGLAGSHQKMQMNTQERASEAAEAAARQQEIMANAAPTTMQAPGTMMAQADTPSTNAGTQARRRYSVDKTTNSGMGLSRLGSGSNSKRKTLA